MRRRPAASARHVGGHPHCDSLVTSLQPTLHSPSIGPSMYLATTAMPTLHAKTHATCPAILRNSRAGGWNCVHRWSAVHDTPNENCNGMQSLDEMRGQALSA